MFCNYKAVLLFTRGSQSMEKKNEDTSLLLKHLQEGDERAFRTLFEEFYASLCLFATRYLGDREEAADVVQETFLKYWNKHTDFDDYPDFKVSTTSSMTFWSILGGENGIIIKLLNPKHSIMYPISSLLHLHYHKADFQNPLYF